MTPNKSSSLGSWPLKFTPQSLERCTVVHFIQKPKRYPTAHFLYTISEVASAAWVFHNRNSNYYLWLTTQSFKQAANSALCLWLIGAKSKIRQALTLLMTTALDNLDNMGNLTFSRHLILDTNYDKRFFQRHLLAVQIFSWKLTR